MKFQILHESRGRARLRAVQRSMSMAQADLLEAWILALPYVDRVTVHERICTVTILFRGERATLYHSLSRFTYAEAVEEAHVLSPHSRSINREYKEKLVFQILRHYGKRLFLPVPVRQILNTVNAIPRILLAGKTLLQGRLTVDVLDGVAIGVSLLTGDFSTAGSVRFLLSLGETLECFEETYEFLDSLDVTQLHVFPYSERPGTSALSIPYTVSDKDKKLRVKLLLELSDRKTVSFY